MSPVALVIALFLLCLGAYLVFRLVVGSALGLARILIALLLFGIGLGIILIPSLRGQIDAWLSESQASMEKKIEGAKALERCRRLGIDSQDCFSQRRAVADKLQARCARPSEQEGCRALIQRAAKLTDIPCLQRKPFPKTKCLERAQRELRTDY